jgi:uncharacterized membrane protein YeaQ/YmgE (transglycosylase-associated protein family)
MARRGTSLALGIGTLIAGLFVAVGILQAYLVTQDRLHDQFGFLAMQLTWIILVPAGVLLVWLGRRLAAQPHRAGAVLLASALLGGVGCIVANVLLQITRQGHPLESYPGLMPAFVLVSVLSVFVAGPLLGVVLGISGPALSTLRSRTA